MLQNKLKNIAALLLTTIFLFTICFSNMVFAVSESDGQETVAEGVYYIRNEMSGSYLNAFGTTSVILSDVYESESLQWELIYVSDGYYYIRNVENNMYLTSPANSTVGSEVELAPLNNLISNRQLWSIENIYYGTVNAYIRSQTQKYNNLYTAASDSIGVYGYGVVQSYDEQFKYNNEWSLEREEIGATRKMASVLGIASTDSECDHSSAMTYIGEEFADANYLTHVSTSVDMNAAPILSQLQSTNIFMMQTHGYYNSSESYAYINSSHTSTIGSSDIYNYSTGSHIDMNGCEIAIFGSCYSSAHSTRNLPLAAVHAGAESAIGFNSEIICEELGGWMGEFVYYYLSGYSVDVATEYATSTVGNSTRDAVNLYTQGG